MDRGREGDGVGGVGGGGGGGFGESGGSPLHAVSMT